MIEVIISGKNVLRPRAEAETYSISANPRVWCRVFNHSTRHLLRDITVIFEEKEVAITGLTVHIATVLPGAINLISKTTPFVGGIGGSIQNYFQCVYGPCVSGAAEATGMVLSRTIQWL